MTDSNWPKLPEQTPTPPKGPATPWASLSAFQKVFVFVAGALTLGIGVYVVGYGRWWP